MAKKLAVFILVLATLIGAGVYISSKANSPQNTSAPIAHEYYWGDGCPHCKVVTDFVESWDKKDQVAIDKKEVWNNRANYSAMLERAKSCNLNSNSLGVPFLYTIDGKCLVGDQPIIDFFKAL